MVNIEKIHDNLSIGNLESFEQNQNIMVDIPIQVFIKYLMSWEKVY